MTKDENIWNPVSSRLRRETWRDLDGPISPTEAQELNLERTSTWLQHPRKLFWDEGLSGRGRIKLLWSVPPTSHPLFGVYPHLHPACTALILITAFQFNCQDFSKIFVLILSLSLSTSILLLCSWYVNNFKETFTLLWLNVLLLGIWDENVTVIVFYYFLHFFSYFLWN